MSNKEKTMNPKPRNSLYILMAILLVLAVVPAGHASAANTPSVSITLRSVGAKDGWVIESTELSGIGGITNVAATTFNLGDDKNDRQYRAILHFDTSSIPDTATILSVKLKIKRQSTVGTNPFTTHGVLRADIRKPFFGSTDALATQDFNATATKNTAASFSATPVSGGNSYESIFSAASLQYINKAGITQFRLRFTLDDNDDLSADLLRFFSGNYSVVSDRPELEIEYQP
jgi:hypothetical protein